MSSCRLSFLSFVPVSNKVKTKWSIKGGKTDIQFKAVFQYCVYFFLVLWLCACARIYWCSVGDMAVFQQTVPDWHSDSSHSELEGGLPDHEGAGTAWLLGYGVLRRSCLAQSCSSQTVERSCCFHPQSASQQQETISWMQTGEGSSRVGFTHQSY